MSDPKDNIRKVTTKVPKGSGKPASQTVKTSGPAKGAAAKRLAAAEKNDGTKST